MTDNVTIDRNILQQVAGISNASLKDIDWNVKLVVSSDKLSNISEPLCTVKFYLETENGPKDLLLEMNKDEMKKFIDSLEATNKSMMQFRL